MRIFLLPLAGVLLVTGLSRAEFDGAGIAAKPNAATGAAFTGVAANRPTQGFDLIVLDARSGDIVGVVGAGVLVKCGGKRIVIINFGAPAQFAKTAGRVKAIHRPANIPSSPFVEPVPGIWFDSINPIK